MKVLVIYGRVKKVLKFEFFKELKNYKERKTS